ncbi:hypothetical protein DLAC_06553 [Tieghemostelium lacteum]|uniref:Uncharacterized protein n=1 Tax=Tieghemostelium lacteum TaxID=361077 RepID=A0A151ZF23_TIELA|nr:hypothetical protein DLAC_06553 [Tieghemostelium lacteum]|eukprot:KYQ92563.1 hypothetical protein DLAC_06553 [Tieghemostelium lacteum]
MSFLGKLFGSTNSKPQKKRIEITDTLYGKSILNNAQIVKTSTSNSKSVIPNILIKLILNIWLRYFNLMTKTYNNDYFIEFLNIVSCISHDWNQDIIPGLNLSHTVDDTFNIHSRKHLRYANLWLRRGITKIKFQINMALTVSDYELVTPLIPNITDLTNFRVSTDVISHKTVHSIIHKSPFPYVTSSAITIRKFQDNQLFNTHLLYTSNEDGDNLEIKTKNLAVIFDGSPHFNNTANIFYNLKYLETLRITSLSSNAWFDLAMSQSITTSLVSLKKFYLTTAITSRQFILDILGNLQKLEHFSFTGTLSEPRVESLPNPYIYNVNTFNYIADWGPVLVDINKKTKESNLRSLVINNKGSSCYSINDFITFINESKLEIFVFNPSVNRMMGMVNIVPNALVDQGSLITNSTLKLLSYGIGELYREVWAEPRLKYLRMKHVHKSINCNTMFSTHLNTLVQLSLTKFTCPLVPEYLCKFIMQTKVLKFLKLSNSFVNSISDILNAVGENRSLVTLFLTKMQVQSLDISNFLKSNHPTITNFGVTKLKNKLYPSSLLESILANKTLCHLNLSGVFPDNNYAENIVILIKILQKPDSKLFHLDYSWNPMFTGSTPLDRKLLNELLSAIINNPILLSLDLYHAQMNYLDELKECYQKCLKLKVCPFNFIEIKSFDQMTD